MGALLLFKSAFAAILSEISTRLCELLLIFAEILIDLIVILMRCAENAYDVSV